MLADLPVGRNLQDHLFVGGIAATIEKPVDIDVSSVSMLMNYAVRRKGKITICFLREFDLYFRFSWLADWRDLNNLKASVCGFTSLGSLENCSPDTKGYAAKPTDIYGTVNIYAHFGSWEQL